MAFDSLYRESKAIFFFPEGPAISFFSVSAHGGPPTRK